jgi:hypothetical protein
MARIGITIPINTARQLARIAEREHRSISGMAAVLIIRAIEAQAKAKVEPADTKATDGEA